MSIFKIEKSNIDSSEESKKEELNKEKEIEDNERNNKIIITGPLSKVLADLLNQKLKIESMADGSMDIDYKEKLEEASTHRNELVVKHSVEIIRDEEKEKENGANEENKLMYDITEIKTTDENDSNYFSSSLINEELKLGENPTTEKESNVVFVYCIYGRELTIDKVNKLIKMFRHNQNENIFKFTLVSIIVKDGNKNTQLFVNTLKSMGIIVRYTEKGTINTIIDFLISNIKPKQEINSYHKALSLEVDFL